MDEDRKIRFLISPLLFFASISWGLLRDGSLTFGSILPGINFKIGNLPDLLSILLGGSIAVFTVGYIIGTITYVILRLAFIIARRFGRGSGSHEIALSDEAFRHIWQKIGASGEPSRAEMFFAGSSFGHDILRKQHEGIHRWIVRRWNAFSVAATSCTALVLSLIVGANLQIKLTPSWFIPVALTLIVLCLAAIIAWRDTMGTLEFQAMRHLEGTTGNQPTATDDKGEAAGIKQDFCMGLGSDR